MTGSRGGSGVGPAPSPNRLGSYFAGAYFPPVCGVGESKP
jgi:hypothetical protein